MDHWGFKMQGLKAKEPQELLAKLEDRRLLVKIEKHLILWSSPKD